MVSTKTLALGLALFAIAGPNGAWAADWRTANQAMGKALEAGDDKAAYNHSLEALRLYLKEGAPSQEMLVNLAINMADMALRSNAPLDASILEFNRVITWLKNKGPEAAGNRLYLHNAILALYRTHGRWQDVLTEHLAIIGATEQAYGPDHPALAIAHAEYARQRQYLGRTYPGNRGIASGSLEAAERIAGKLAPEDPNRAAIQRMLAIYDIEGRRHGKAVRRLEEALAPLSPDNEAQTAVWHQLMGTLAAALSRQGETEQSDATIATLIANTKENAEPQPLVMWSPEPLEDWNEDRDRSAATAHFDIGPDVRAQNIRGELIEGNPQYPAYVVDAIKKWRWLPVIRNGVPEVSRDHSQSFGAIRQREPRTGSRLP